MYTGKQRGKINIPEQENVPNDLNNLPDNQNNEPDLPPFEPENQNNKIPQVNSKEELEALRKSLTEDNVKNPDHVVQNRELFLQVSGEFKKAHPQEKKKRQRSRKSPRRNCHRRSRPKERKNGKTARRPYKANVIGMRRFMKAMRNSSS